MTSPEGDRPLRSVPPHRYVDFQMAGDGAMGLVYFAVDTELKRNVAFKIVRPDGRGAMPRTPMDVAAPKPDSHFAELRARFLQEAWVTGGMEHPGIVPVYELGQTEGGVPYYTMRFVPGQRTLKSALEELQDRPFEERLGALESFLKLCDAVSYAHSKGVIHRDIKPANVALGEFGEVVLLDWGLAKLLDQTESTGAGAALAARAAKSFDTGAGGLGTPGYMPPEAIRGSVEDLDDRSDVYSLGVILFQILTGQLPFRLVPFQDYLDKAVHQDPPDARTLNPSVPVALAGLCAQALCRDRVDRLGSARALAEGVRGWRTQTALERELQGLIRDAENALAAAAESRGPSRIRQAQRALVGLAQARKRDPGNPRIQQLAAQARALQDRGIKETQSAGRQRLVLVGGVVLFGLLSIAAFVVAGLFNAKKKEAETDRLRADKALVEAEVQRADAQLQRSVALEAKRVIEQKATEWQLTQDLFWEFADDLVEDGVAAQRLSGAADTGIEEAVAQQDGDALLRLLEQARDAKPLARLSMGMVAPGLSFPPALRDAAQRARRRAARAQKGMRAAQAGSRQEKGEAARELADARREHASVLQEGFKALERLLESRLPGTAGRRQIQASLGSDDVFVSYGHAAGRAVAVVIEKSAHRTKSLGPARGIEFLVYALRDAIDNGRDIAELTHMLRQRIVAPLLLPSSGGRLIFVPQGATLLVPFGLLLPSRTVCILPSAGAWLHLGALPASVGEGVLAAAAPFSEQGDSSPGVRAEAEAIGDTTLLGEDLTWSNLASALAGKTHWRAVHLGQGGRIARTDSREAHLEITATDEADGMLGVFEIARLNFSADLVVLSTAYPIAAARDLRDLSLDLPQALLFAGARRVLFPTARTDDEATQALMIKFYELWNPKGGKKGLGCAAALRAAQAFVRSHAAWEDPDFWAPWVLWGLP